MKRSKGRRLKLDKQEPEKDEGLKEDDFEIDEKCYKLILMDDFPLHSSLYC